MYIGDAATGSGLHHLIPLFLVIGVVGPVVARRAAAQGARPSRPADHSGSVARNAVEQSLAMSTTL